MPLAFYCTQFHCRLALLLRINHILLCTELKPTPQFVWWHLDAKNIARLFNCSQWIIPFQKCVDKEPARRWSCEQLLRHPYFEHFRCSLSSSDSRDSDARLARPNRVGTALPQSNEMPFHSIDLSRLGHKLRVFGSSPRLCGFKNIPAQWAKIRQGLDIFRISSKCVCRSNGEV